MKKLLFFILLFSCLHSFSKTTGRYPAGVEAVLRKAGTNRSELEKAISYCKKSGDPLKLKAVYFLVANMDIHYSSDYYWADSKGQKIPYNELNYPDFPTSVKAFDQLKAKNPGIHPVPIIYQDINTIKAQFLIDDIENAFIAWKSPYSNKLSFDNFCEYILPYRVSIEPLQLWRSVYRKNFQHVLKSGQNKSTAQIIPYFANDFANTFLNSYNIEDRIEPLPRLGPLQLLQRKKGACEDISDYVAFMMRSQGIPVSMDEVSFWATSNGRHFFNTVFDSQMHGFPVFDISTPGFTNSKFEHEPAKVLRITYGKQSNTLATKVPLKEIPPGFMRTVNYLDITTNYWETQDVTCKLFNSGSTHNLAFLCVFNTANWRPTWWGKVQNNSVTFSSMCKGSVFLPTYFLNNRIKVAGYPVAVGYYHQVVLKPDVYNKTFISLSEQDKYLIFRPGKSYKLYYWDNEWKFIAKNVAISGSHELLFGNVPKNALLILIPEYSTGLERPFIITDEGKRQWF